MLGHLIRWIGDGRRAGKLRRQARGTTDLTQRAELLLRAARLDDVPSLCLEAAVALAQAGRLDDSAVCWRRALQLKPVLIPSDEQADALLPVLPRVAHEVLAGLTGHPGFLEYRWKLEHRGRLDGEERWRLETERYDEMELLLPALRFIALVVAHTVDAPGRIRIDCDHYDSDTERYMPIGQLGEAIISWDADRRITDVRVQA